MSNQVRVINRFSDGFTVFTNKFATERFLRDVSRLRPNWVLTVNMVDAHTNAAYISVFFKPQVKQCAQPACLYSVY